ncbi:hypothetical protein KSP40_PGU021209 [Platanthera guangdongensis]|uniref:Uncharacterized protein n=1 Tax=Platanthera guangdongensis TaxID=2320717 RepID=A0ABR2MX31_9ASPA
MNYIRNLGDNIEDVKIVPKIIRCLTPVFNPMVTAIEEARGLSVLSLSCMDHCMHKRA